MSPAAQNDELIQETDHSDETLTKEGADQVEPLNASALPEVSTASQNVALEHETEFRPNVSIAEGDDQVDPLNMIAFL